MEHGTFALLVTDVVDSTKLADELGALGAAELWSAHDRVARRLLREHGGREIDKTDGFLLLFGHAGEALRYAAAYHRALRSIDPPLRARAGLHVGEVVLRANPAEEIARGAKPLEVDGVAKSLAARVMSVARGGQTLLTAAARTGVGDPWRVVSHGHWRMKGVAEPVELYEAADDDSPMAPPPDGSKVYRVVRDGGRWLPAREVRHSLPAERDQFVGRHADLRALADLLDGSSRLVTVLGIGGTGKTRLVTHFGWTWLGDWPGGVWFCDLSDATTRDGVLSAVAGALAVPLGSADPVAQIADVIEGRGRCLVLLDNLEQVTAIARDLVSRWLDRSPEASFVATSREILGLPGEQLMQLSPLPETDAEALFVARARDARADFSLGEGDAERVAELVELLDGLPLALELAAARVRMLPVSGILARMSDRFRLLTGGRGRPSRQATLRGALEWSWDLLVQWERAAFAQCSVFEGGFSVDAAEEVLDLADWPDAPWALDAVQDLLDKSLLRRADAGRLEMLASVREYAASKLATPGAFDGSGPEAESAARHRHGRYYAEQARALVRPGAGRVCDIVAWAVRELDNFAAAARRATRRGDGPTAAWAVRGAWIGLELRGPYSAGSDLVEEVLAMPGLDGDALAALCLVAGEAWRLLGRHDDALGILTRGVEAAQGCADVALEARLWFDIGRVRLDHGDHVEASAAYERSLACARQAGDRATQGNVLGNLGNLQNERGLMGDAVRLYEEALVHLAASGDRRGEGVVTGNMGSAFADRGHLERAEELYHKAVAMMREAGDVRVEGVFIGNLGVDLAAAGRLDEALEQYAVAGDKAREVGDRRHLGIWQGNAGELLIQLGRLPAAEEALQRALVLHREVGNRRFEGEVLAHLAHVDLLDGRLDRAWSRCVDGEALLRAVDDRVVLIKVLALRAEIGHQRGEPALVRSALDEADALATEIGATPDSLARQAIARARAAIASGG